MTPILQDVRIQAGSAWASDSMRAEDYRTRLYAEGLEPVTAPKTTNNHNETVLSPSVVLEQTDRHHSGCEPGIRDIWRYSIGRWSPRKVSETAISATVLRASLAQDE